MIKEEKILSRLDYIIDDEGKKSQSMIMEFEGEGNVFGRQIVTKYYNSSPTVIEGKPFYFLGEQIEDLSKVNPAFIQYCNSYIKTYVLGFNKGLSIGFIEGVKANAEFEENETNK